LKMGPIGYPEMLVKATNVRRATFQNSKNSWGLIFM
jgi:hypothetical protein